MCFRNCTPSAPTLAQTAPLSVTTCENRCGRLTINHNFLHLHARAILILSMSTVTRMPKITSRLVCPSMEVFFHCTIQRKSYSLANCFNKVHSSVTRGTHVTRAMAVASEAKAPRYKEASQIVVAPSELLAMTLRALLDETGHASFVQVWKRIKPDSCSSLTKLASS